MRATIIGIQHLLLKYKVLIVESILLSLCVAPIPNLLFLIGTEYMSLCAIPFLVELKTTFTCPPANPSKSICTVLELPSTTLLSVSQKLQPVHFTVIILCRFISSRCWLFLQVRFRCWIYKISEHCHISMQKHPEYMWWNELQLCWWCLCKNTCTFSYQVPFHSSAFLRNRCSAILRCICNLRLLLNIGLLSAVPAWNTKWNKYRKMPFQVYRTQQLIVKLKSTPFIRRWKINFEWLPLLVFLTFLSVSTFSLNMGSIKLT